MLHANHRCDGTFFWKLMSTRCGCMPSDCQYVSSRPSRSMSTPFPGFALVTLQTASCPTSRVPGPCLKLATTASQRK